MDSILTGWWFNPTFWAGLSGWVIAQAIKTILGLYKTRRMNFAYFVSTGGMPSAHSSMASAIATSVALREGTASPIFALALAFAVVVMFDAQSARRAISIQARILNQMIEELFKSHRFPEGKLAELLGHTPIEVFIGMITGVLSALLIHSL